MEKCWKSTSVPPVLSLTLVLLDSFVRALLSIFIRWVFHLFLKDVWESSKPRGEGRLLVSRYASGTWHRQGNVPPQIWKAEAALEDPAVFHWAEAVVGISYRPLLPWPNELESTTVFSWWCSGAKVCSRQNTCICSPPLAGCGAGRVFTEGWSIAAFPHVWWSWKAAD